VVAVVFDVDAVALFREAQVEGIYGPGFVWITADATTTSAVEDGLVDDPAGSRALVEGLLNFYVSSSGSDGFVRFKEAWASAQPSDCENSVFAADASLFSAEPFHVAAFAYDCMVAVAVAVSNSTRGAAAYTAFLATDFDGASGKVSLDVNGDRDTESVSFVLDNWRRSDDGGQGLSIVRAGTFSLAAGLQLTGEPLIWLGGGEEKPLDLADAASFLPLGLVYAFYSVTGAGVAFAFCCAVWLFAKRATRLVKVSQPAFLMAVLIGSVVSMCSIFPAMLDNQFFEPVEGVQEGPGRFPPLDVACNAQVWLYSLGFLCSVGSLLIKLWRITRIVTNTKVVLPPLPAWQLYGRVGALLGVQLVVLVTWAVTSPLYYAVVVDKVHGVTVDRRGSCQTDGVGMVFLAITVIFVLSVLVYGNWLCYRAREIPVQYAESKYIAFALANHLQTKSFAVLAVIFTVDVPTVLAIVKFIAVIVSDLGTIALVFIPKMVLLHHEGSTGMVGAREKLTQVAIRAWNKAGEEGTGGAGPRVTTDTRPTGSSSPSLRQQPRPLAPSTNTATAPVAASASEQQHGGGALCSDAVSIEVEETDCESDGVESSEV